MIKDVLNTGVEAALAKYMPGNGNAAEITSAIAATAPFDNESGRQLLTVDPTSNKLMQFDILKAVLAAAGVVGATVPLVAGPLGIASVLSAMGALGALQGLKEPLPSTCAQLVICLLPKRKMSPDKLKEAFKDIYDGTKDLAETEFERALERLEQVGSVRLKQGEVQLVERVLVRW